MEQLEFIREKLKINQFPEINTRQFGTLRAPEVILFFLLTTFIFSLIGFYSFTYLTLGFALPALCRHKDIKIFNYWECLAMLLFFRTFSDSFASLDGLLLVFLWHPNFKGGLKLIEWVKSLKDKGVIDKGINQVKKIL